MNKIMAFMNQVEAFMKGKKPKLTAAQGQPLLDAANAIVDQILASP